MANEIELINGVTRYELQGSGNYKYLFPLATFIVYPNADPNLGYYKHLDLRGNEILQVTFQDITDKLGANNIVEYVNALAENTLFFGVGLSASVLPATSRTGWGSYTDTNHIDLGTAFTVPANTDTIFPNNAGTKIETQKPSDVDTFYAPDSLLFDNQTNDFVIGETVTGSTSGATGVIVSQSDTGTTGILYFSSSIGVFIDNETITSASGSAIANGTNRGGEITGRNGDSLDVMLYCKAVPSAVNQYVDIWIDIGGLVGELYRLSFGFPRGAGIERGLLYALPSAYTLNTWQANGGRVYLRSDAPLDIYGINFNFDRTHKGI